VIHSADCRGSPYRPTMFERGSAFVLLVLLSPHCSASESITATLTSTTETSTATLTSTTETTTATLTSSSMETGTTATPTSTASHTQTEASFADTSAAFVPTTLVPESDGASAIRQSIVGLTICMFVVLKLTVSA